MSFVGEGVWTLAISHKHGIDTTVHASIEGARDWLMDWCKEWWMPEFGEQPLTTDELIDRYFEEMEDREWYELNETQVLP
jgi:hypothetical protein